MNEQSLDFMRQAFGSPGGKSRVADKLIKLIPEHKVYCEVFAGGAAIFFKKDKKDDVLEIINDKDYEIAFTYSFIKDVTESQIEDLKKMTWRSDKEYFDQVKKSKPTNDVERFHKFIYMNRFSFGKMMKNYFNPKEPQNSAIVSRIPQIRDRLKGVKIYSEDYLNLIRKYDSPNTFFFIDPPYPIEWPVAGAFTFEDMQKMTDELKKIKGKFLLTIDSRPQYMKMFSSFEIRKLLYPRTLQKQGTWTKQEYELLIANYSIKDIKFSQLDFIHNVAEYDPTELDNEVLADDWRIVSAWYSTFVESNGEGIKYSKEDIVNLAKIIYDEISSRVEHGRMNHEFKPEDMKVHSKELYDIVSKGKEVPKFSIDFDKIPKIYMPNKQANLAWHDECMMIVKDKNLPDLIGKPILLCDSNNIFGIIRMRPATILDNKQFSEMEIRHKITPDEAVNMFGKCEKYYSYEFEWIEKYSNLIANSNSFSQVEVDNTLDKFKDMTLIDSFISVAGGFIDKEGKNYSDIDMIVRMTPPNDFIKRAIQSRFMKELPENVVKDIHLVFDTEGPHSKFVPLYDLVIKRREKEFVKMSQDGASVTIMKSYLPQKPQAPALYSLDDVNSKIEPDKEYSVEYKFNGFHACIHKKGNEAKIFSEQEHDITSAFPTLVDFIKTLSAHDFIIDGEILQLGANGETLGRNEMMKFIGAVKSGDKIDDSNVHLFVWDMLYYK
jgi:DNA adenine methylase